MNLRKSFIWVLSSLLLLVAGMASFILNAANIENCPDTDKVCIDLPEIIDGNVTENGHFSGSIEIASNFVVRDMFENVNGYYSLDGGQNWLSGKTVNNYRLGVPPIYVPHAAVLVDGDYVVVWEESNNIYMRRFDSQGMARTADPQIVAANVKHITVSSVSMPSARPKISRLSSGGYFVTWTTRYDGTYGPIVLLNYKTYSSKGALVGSGEVTRIGVQSYAAGQIYDVQMLPSANGVLVAVQFAVFNSTGPYTIIRLYEVNLSNAAVSNIYNTDYMTVPSNTSMPERVGFDFGASPDNNVVLAYNDNSSVIHVVKMSYDGLTQYSYPVYAKLVYAPKQVVDDVGKHFVSWNDPQDGIVKTVIMDKHGQILSAPFDIGAGIIRRVFNYGSGGFGVVLQGSNALDVYNIDNVLTGRNIVHRYSVAPYAYGDAYITDDYSAGNVILPGVNELNVLPYWRHVSSGVISPNADISVMFKVTDSANTDWFSDVRHYKYGDSNDGSAIQIDYPNGLTKANEVLVNIPDTVPQTDPPKPVCITCSTFEVSERKVAVQNGDCPPMPANPLLGWLPVKTYTTLTGDDDPIAVDDGFCYQFKVATTNMNGTGNHFEYINPNVVQVDRTAPTITYIAENVVWDSAILDLTFQDENSGINQGTAEYQVNNGTFVPFSGSVALVPGTNFVKVEVEDNAGNVGTYSHTFFFDNTPPDIIIHTIEDGGTYGADVSLDFSLTQPLTNLTILVDGMPRSDLVGLADGVHTIVISGYDTQGNLVQKTVTFTKDSTLFTVTVLSPYSGTYDINDITIDYTASKPVLSATYTLDGVNGGALTSGMVLPDLADGNHLLSLVFTPTTGVPVTKDIPFTVKDGIPALNVFAPVEGAIYPANKFVAEFSVDLSSSVSYQIVGQDGVLSDPVPITSGTEVPVPSDGPYTLILTATHGNSGNQLSQMVQFTTDAVQPAITLASPHTGVYTFDTVPINYTSNKPLTSVEYFLDGNQVTELVGLTTGPHSFRIQAKDNANRVTQQVVQFNVATLEILSPQNGESVISNTMPPQLPFQYGTTGGFTSFTAAVDNGPRQLLVDPPGATIPLPMSPGDHEVTLRGQVYGLTAAKRADFTIGAMNVSIGKGSLNYTYANCDAVTSVCDVTASVRVTNSGDYAVNKPITVRFDHIAAGGYQTQWQTVAGLPIGQSAEVSFPPFQATLGDTFAAFVDPNAEIAGEWSTDNAYSLTFQTGQISAVIQKLAQENVYLEGVSTVNPLVIETAGAIVSVEVLVNGWTFVDSDGANGFNLIADMGLLADNSECVQIIARSNAAVVLDSQSMCFDVRPIHPTPVAKYEFPWAAFSQGNQMVNVETLRLADVAATMASLRMNALQELNTVLPVLSDNGEVIYKSVSDPALALNQPHTRAVDMGSNVLGGVSELPNGHGMFIAEINTVDSACTMPDAIPILTKPTSGDLSEFYQEDMDKANEELALSRTDFANSVDGLDFLMYTVGGGILHYGLSGSAEGQPYMGVFDGLMLGGWENQMAEISAEHNYVYGFDAIGCFIPESPSGVTLTYASKYIVDLDATAKVDLRSQNHKIIGVLAGIYGPLVPVTAFVFGDVHVYAASVNVQTNLDVSLQIAINNESFYLMPFFTGFMIDTHFHGKLAKTDVYALGHVAGILGFYHEQKDFWLHMDGTGKADYGFGASSTGWPAGYEFQYADAYGYLHERTKTTTCVLVFCSSEVKNDYTDMHDNKSKTIPPREDPIGSDYQQEDVDRERAKINPMEFGQTNDLADTGLYKLIIGDTEAAAEYLSCATLESLVVPNMPFTKLYSARSGSCTPVMDPDYEYADGVQYYTDASCTSEVDYKPTSFMTYCRDNLLSPNNETYVGNAAAWLDEEGANPAYSGIGKNTKWTLSHGPSLYSVATYPRFDGHRNSDSPLNMRPYVKQIEYRQVGECHLEMRVYKKDITATNLKPLMLLHGGGWEYRGFGAIGAEGLVSHLTERGFIVFLPYYRLLDGSDGPVECQIPRAMHNGVHPGELIVQDIDAALTWVNANGSILGSAGGQVTLVGQSAGAHLSGWLATYRSAEVAKTFLVYPPADLAYTVELVLGGQLPDTHPGKSIMDDFFGVDVATLVSGNLPPFINMNAFPSYARQNSATYPPTVMIHGNADSLVPVDMSMRMCDALAGKPDVPPPYTTPPPYTAIEGEYSCGVSRGVTNVMHIIDGADHMLDLRCFVDMSTVDEVLNTNFADYNVCPSGSRATSDNIVRQAMVKTFDWLAAP